MGYSTTQNVHAVVLETCRTYNANAGTYGCVTSDYGDYPGLREEVMRFEHSSPEGLPLLDLGSGAGRDSRLLADRERRVVAGDLARELLKMSRVACRDAGVSFPHVQLDMAALPFADQVFGGVWASASMVHVPAICIGRILSEVLRTLASGGVTYISMRSGDGEGWQTGGSVSGRRWFSLWKPSEFLELMERAGFREVDVSFVGRPGWFVATGSRS